MSLDTQPKSNDSPRIYFRVGMFFEKQVEIDEQLPEDEVKKWAQQTADRIAGYHGMNITEVVVVANE